VGSWQFTGYYDFALLQLAQPVTLSETVNLVCLPIMQEDRNLYDVPSTVSGWGHISRGLLSRVLRSTTLKILSPYACNYFTRGQGVIMDHSIQICAHQPYELTGPCHGDSGGKHFIIVLLVYNIK
jgi:hypothetical protein